MSTTPEQAPAPTPPQPGRSRVVLLVAAAVVLIAGVAGVLYQSRSTSTTAQPPAAASNSVDGVTTIGTPDATITVDIWEDFQCPYCKVFETSDAAAIIADAIDQNKVRVNYHILSFLDRGQAGASTRAANAALCANDQNRFPAFHAWAYAHQPVENTDGYKNEDLIAYGPKIGIADQGAYAACVTNGTHLGAVKKANDSIIANNIQGTPTVQVDGTALDLAKLTAASLKKALGIG